MYFNLFDFNLFQPYPGARKSFSIVVNHNFVIGCWFWWAITCSSYQTPNLESPNPELFSWNLLFILIHFLELKFRIRSFGFGCWIRWARYWQWMSYVFFMLRQLKSFHGQYFCLVLSPFSWKWLRLQISRFKISQGRLEFNGL